MRIAVLGATGKTGRYLVSRLCREGDAVVAISRSADRLAEIDSCAEKRVADILVPDSIRAALADVDCVVSLVHARLTAALLPSLPARCGWVVLTGSVRRSTALPDPAADAVRAGEAAFAAWRARGGRGVMLHPGMIYGAREDRNVGRLVRLLRAWPRFLPVIVPLPDGGVHTVQPVYFEDLVASIVASVRRAPDVPPAVEIVGPAPIPYRTFVQETAAAVGRRVWVVPVPLGVISGVLAVLGGLIRLPFTAAELRRGTESKQFDPGPMRAHLGVQPRPFSEGVREKVSRGWF